jgi:ribosomal protein S27E
MEVKMGDRYYLKVICPYCKHHQEEDVYYAPTSGFMTHDCEKCGKTIDLEKYSGIDAESTATTEYGVRAVKSLKKNIRRSQKAQECDDVGANEVLQLKGSSANGVCKKEANKK